MLVLTRKNDESIVFPEIGVTLSVLRIRGNVVKIGVNAPKEITVLRKEVLEDPERAAEFASSQSERRHDLRNQMHTLRLALHLLEKLIGKGRHDEANRLLERVVKGFASLEELVTGETPKAIDAPTNAGSTKRTALLVEDDANQSELLAGYLQLSGFDVETAGDGDEALNVLADGVVPDVVLLDMFMPRVNGAETIARIRHIPKLEQLKVFAISGTDPSELGVPSGPAGVDRWFPKPLDPASLVRTLRHELASRA